MINVIYDPKFGYTCPDDLVKTKVQEYVMEVTDKNSDYTFTVGSELFILEFRMAALNNYINYQDIVFHFRDSDHVEHIINMNSDYRLSHYPKGFCDHNCHILAALL